MRIAVAVLLVAALFAAQADSASRSKAKQAGDSSPYRMLVDKTAKPSGEAG
jgi:hypothetical protein